MRHALLWLALLALGCDDAVPPPAATPEPPPEAAPEPAEPPPPLGVLDAPAAGQATIAVPTLASGWTYPQATLEAGFGKNAELWLIELKPTGEADDATPSIQLTFHGAELAPGTHRVMLERDGLTHVFTVALGRTQLRVLGGEIVLTSVNDDRIEGSLDLEVQHPLHAHPTRLRGRLHATRDRYYDAALEHERRIREQLKRR